MIASMDISRGLPGCDRSLFGIVFQTLAILGMDHASTSTGGCGESYWPCKAPQLGSLAQCHLNHRIQIFPQDTEIKLREACTELRNQPMDSRQSVLAKLGGKWCLPPSPTRKYLTRPGLLGPSCSCTAPAANKSSRNSTYVARDMH